MAGLAGTSATQRKFEPCPTSTSGGNDSLLRVQFLCVWTYARPGFAGLSGPGRGGIISRHRTDEPAELPRSLLLVPFALAAGGQFVHRAALSGNHCLEVAIFGPNPPGSISAPELVLPSQMVCG